MHSRAKYELILMVVKGCSPYLFHREATRKSSSRSFTHLIQIKEKYVPLSAVRKLSKDFGFTAVLQQESCEEVRRRVKGKIGNIQATYRMEIRVYSQSNLTPTISNHRFCPSFSAGRHHGNQVVARIRQRRPCGYVVTPNS